MQFGSLQNQLLGNAVSKKPEVGMGATEIMYSDRHAYTIAEVLRADCILVQQDIAVRTDGLGITENQKWEFEPDPEALSVTLTRRKDGTWQIKGSRDCSVFVLGVRLEYYDFSR